MFGFLHHGQRRLWRRYPPEPAAAAAGGGYALTISFCDFLNFPSHISQTQQALPRQRGSACCVCLGLRCASQFGQTMFGVLSNFLYTSATFPAYHKKHNKGRAETFARRSPHPAMRGQPPGPGGGQPTRPLRHHINANRRTGSCLPRAAVCS